MRQAAKMCFVIFLLFQPCLAINIFSPAYSFEGLLPRAETIFIGRLGNHSEKEAAFEILEVLRGQADQAPPTFGFSGYGDQRLTAAGQSYLIISQGDKHFGKPKAIISVGQVLKGQAGYCGWIAFPLKKDGNSIYLDLIGQKPGTNPARLTLDKAKVLAQRIPYKSV